MYTQVSDGKKNQTQVKREEIFKKIGFNWSFWYIKVFKRENYTNPKKDFELTLMNITLL